MQACLITAAHTVMKINLSHPINIHYGPHRFSVYRPRWNRDEAQEKKAAKARFIALRATISVAGFTELAGVAWTLHRLPSLSTCIQLQGACLSESVFCCVVLCLCVCTSAWKASTLFHTLQTWPTSFYCSPSCLKCHQSQRTGDWALNCFSIPAETVAAATPTAAQTTNCIAVCCVQATKKCRK